MSKDGLKQKTLNSFIWSFIDIFVRCVVNFLVGIILARILSPEEFGLIAMAMVFIEVSRMLVDAGLSDALIRNKDCSQKDYSTVFYFRAMSGFVFYGLLFLFAPNVGIFYHEPQIVDLIRVFGFILLIESAGVIQKVILTRSINFKLQAQISIVASVSSGILGIWLAYKGWGVWSLVWRAMAQEIVITALLWSWNTWRPARLFDRGSLKELFGFGSKLAVSAVLDTLYTSSVSLVVGKVYSAAELGYFTWANTFQRLPSATLTWVVQRVSYPVLSSVSDENERMKGAYKKLTKNTMFLSFFLLIGIAATAHRLVTVLIGEKWLPVVPYLQLLCFSGMLYPLHALNLNILNVKGRSDLFLRLEIIKKFLAIPVLIAGVFYGIKAMLALILIHTVVGYFLSAFWSAKMIDYPVNEQLTDIAPAFGGAALTGICIYMVGGLLPYTSIGILIAQSVAGLVMAVLVARLVKLDGYTELRDLVAAKFRGVV